MTKVKDLDICTTPSASEVKEKKESSNSTPNIRNLMNEEQKLVRGRFRNFEHPGQAVPVHVRKYKDIPPFNMTMVDGEIYEIPLYVARFLQGYDSNAKHAGYQIHTCSVPVHSFTMDKNDPFPKVNAEEFKEAHIIHRRRMGFESLEFESAM